MIAAAVGAGATRAGLPYLFSFAPPWASARSGNRRRDGDRREREKAKAVHEGSVSDPLNIDAWPRPRLDNARRAARTRPSFLVNV